MVEGGWLGITMPEAYGGAGLGLTEAGVTMRTVTKSGGAQADGSFLSGGEHPRLTKSYLAILIRSLKCRFHPNL